MEAAMGLMDQSVVYLDGKPEPIGHFLRIGSSGHRRLETLLGSGKMMIDRVVVDAAAVGAIERPGRTSCSTLSG